jgi:hypothetical protein
MPSKANTQVLTIVRKPGTKTVVKVAAKKPATKLATKVIPNPVSAVKKPATKVVASTKVVAAPKPKLATKVVAVNATTGAVTKKINRAVLSKFASRLELLEAIKACIAGHFIPQTPDIGGINKLGKQALLKYVDRNVAPRVYNLIVKSRKQIAGRSLEGEQKILFDTFNKHNCTDIIKAIKAVQATEDKEHKTLIANMYTARKNILIFSIIDSGKAAEIATHLPALPEPQPAETTTTTTEETTEDVDVEATEEELEGIQAAAVEEQEEDMEVEVDEE